jgi:hypothetical protein
MISEEVCLHPGNRGLAFLLDPGAWDADTTNTSGSPRSTN